MSSAKSYLQRPIPLSMIVLVAIVIHGPLLLMELPATTSYDSNLTFSSAPITRSTGSIPGTKNGSRVFRKRHTRR